MKKSPVKVPYERLLQLFTEYVAFDAEAADPAYLREVLFDVIGMTNGEAKSLGFGNLVPESPFIGGDE